MKVYTVYYWYDEVDGLEDEYTLTYSGVVGVFTNKNDAEKARKAKSEELHVKGYGWRCEVNVSENELQ